MKTDRHGNPILTWTYFSLDHEAKVAFYNLLGRRITYHKKLYYMKATPELSDLEYDALERLYEAVAEDLGLEPVASNQVGVK